MNRAGWLGWPRGMRRTPCLSRTGQSVSVVLFATTMGLLQAADAPSAEQARQQLERSGTEVTIERLVQHAAQGDASTVALLIAAGVSPQDAEAKRKVTPLHAAASQGHLRLATRILELGADVDAADWHGATPLIHAANFGKSDMVMLLLSHGAEPDRVPREAPTALVSAVQAGSLDVVHLLLKAGAKADLNDFSGISPIRAAELSGRTAILAVLRQSASGDAR